MELNSSAGKIRTYDRSVNSRLTSCYVTLANPQKSEYTLVTSYHVCPHITYCDGDILSSKKPIARKNCTLNYDLTFLNKVFNARFFRLIS